MPDKTMRYARLSFYPSDFPYCVIGPPGIDTRKWGGQFCLSRDTQGWPQYYEFTESPLRFEGARAVYEWVPVEESRVRAITRNY